MSDALQVSSADPASRTTLKFQVSGSPWETIDQWAAQHGYRQTLQPGDPQRQRVYQRGIGFWVAPMMLAVNLDGDALTLQAWVRMTLFVRIMALFILPAEMGVQSGGFRAVLPRKMARDKVNILLAQLSQPPIP
jgi:hypothetical protein